MGRLDSRSRRSQEKPPETRSPGDILVLDVSEGNIGGLFCSSLLRVRRGRHPNRATWGRYRSQVSPFGYMHKGTPWLSHGGPEQVPYYHESEETRGQEAFRRLAAQADVVVETFNPASWTNGG